MSDQLPSLEGGDNKYEAWTVAAAQVLLFRNEYALSSLAPEATAALGELAPYALPPDSTK